MTNNKYHPRQEEIVDILVSKTQSTNKHFFRLLTVYHFAQMASMMRTVINTKDRGILPVNLYVLALAVSGFGKNHSLNILEDQIFSGFKKNFLDEVFPQISDINLQKIANIRSMRDNLDPDETLDAVKKEFASLGVLAFNFDSGTVPAIKQMRQKLLMANAGSINFIADEIGSNLVGNTEVLTAYLELFDVGTIKQKLTKNTKENTRSEEIDGRTPTNALLFGTPDKLLDGGKIEEEFNTMLSTGYARRLLCGYTTTDCKPSDQTPEELYDALTDKTMSNSVISTKQYFTGLASDKHFNRQLQISKDVTIELLRYKLGCEKKAKQLGIHEEIRKAEIIHRYFKVLKLAGSYAFIDKTLEITQDHIDYAINLVEDSGEHFKKIMHREGSYVRLAQYLADVNKEVTKVDLIESLPFFRGTEAHRHNMMTLAMAHGYKNNIIIKKSYVDDIEFYKGESLKETDLNEIIISYSNHIAEGYDNAKAKFSELHKLTQLKGYHFTSHHLLDGYRDGEHVKEGFNICIIDVDDGINMAMAQELLKDYQYLTYTTKRHTDSKNRFRLIMPLSHHVKLSEKDYKRFMMNIFDWLPFDSDTQTNQRSRKWLTFNGEYKYNDGKLLDATRFIPRTDKAVKQQKYVVDNQDMSNLQRWFAKNAETGNRSNILLRYGLCLLDNGKDVDDIRSALIEFNNKIPEPLDPIEIDRSIMITVAKRSNK